MSSTTRRAFIGAVARTGAAAAVAGRLPAIEPETSRYEGPRILFIRFGGGVRRQETLDETRSFSPFFLKKLAPLGTLFPQMEINSGYEDGVGHGKGTLYLMTGKYAPYSDIQNGFLQERYEPAVPTLFEYFRKSYQIPERETLIINGEDRVQEEFYSFSNHHLFGVQYRSQTLSLFRYKRFLLERALARFDGPEEKRSALETKLAEMVAEDYRKAPELETDPQLTRFWERWHDHYGATGLVNPRGDRVLTELAVRAIRELRAKMILINYNDPDYVHWGYMAHYTRAISIIDQEIQRLWDTVQADPEYRNNTLFVIAPDCGRDTNPFLRVPCQHHFGPGSGKIFSLLVGPGVQPGQVVDKPVEQIDLAPTIGALTKTPFPHAEGRVLEEAIA